MQPFINYYAQCSGNLFRLSALSLLNIFFYSKNVPFGKCFKTLAIKRKYQKQAILCHHDSLTGSGSNLLCLVMISILLSNWICSKFLFPILIHVYSPITQAAWNAKCLHLKEQTSLVRPLQMEGERSFANSSNKRRRKARNMKKKVVLAVPWATLAAWQM